MKKYCMSFKIKQKFVKDYVNIHKNAWPEQVNAIRESGAEKCVMYMYDNISILYCECADVDKWLENLSNNETYKKWLKVVGPWMEKNKTTDNPINFLEKIFDLEQQLEGAIKPY